MGRYRSNKRKPCAICRECIYPNPRLGRRQKTCGRQACKKAYRAQYRCRYRRKNRQIDREYEEKRSSKRPSDYWINYRKDHPDYVMRNRIATRLRKRLSKNGLQRQFDAV